MSNRHPFIPCAACGKGTGIHSVPISHLIFCDATCRENYVTARIDLATHSISLRDYFVRLIRSALSVDHDFLNRLSDTVRQSLEHSGIHALVFANPIDHIRPASLDERYGDDPFLRRCRITTPEHRCLSRQPELLIAFPKAA
jgi:hypothetical protein